MSLIGILSSNLFAAGAAHNTQSSQNNPSNFEQIKTEFQQLGQDLKSGNLTRRSRFLTLSQNFPEASQTGGNPVLQAFTQLGRICNQGTCRGAAGLHTFNRTCSRSPQQVGGITPPSSRGKLAIFLFFPAGQSDRPGFQHIGAGFAGGKSFGSAIGVCDPAERSSANRRFPHGGIERNLQHGCAVEYRQPECDRLISSRVPRKSHPS